MLFSSCRVCHAEAVSSSREGVSAEGSHSYFRIRGMSCHKSSRHARGGWQYRRGSAHNRTVVRCCCIIPDGSFTTSRYQTRSGRHSRCKSARGRAAVRRCVVTLGGTIVFSGRLARNCVNRGNRTNEGASFEIVKATPSVVCNGRSQPT